MGLEPRVKLDVAGKFENFLTSYSRAFSSQTCTFGVQQEKQLQKDPPKHFFVAGMDKYFPISFW